VFWKEKATVAAQVGRWRTPQIRAVLNRLLETERAIKRSGTAGDVLATQAMLGIATLAATRG
jgi:DNA polymerase III delta subunit